MALGGGDLGVVVVIVIVVCLPPPPPPGRDRGYQRGPVQKEEKMMYTQTPVFVLFFPFFRQDKGFVSASDAVRELGVPMLSTSGSTLS